MLRGGVLPSVAVGVLAVAVSSVVQGALGAAGSGLAAVLVVVSAASTMVFLRRMAGLDPRVVFLGAMVAYFFKVALLGVFLLVFRNADWLSPMAFAVTAILVSLAGTTGAIHLLLRRRPHAWPVSAMLAPLVTGLSLAGVLTLFPQ